MKRMIPALLALAASAMTAAGVYCAMTFVFCIAWGKPGIHPIALPVSLVGGLGCFCLFILAACLYVRRCFREKRRWWWLFDLGLYLLTLLPFFQLWCVIAELIMG